MKAVESCQHSKLNFSENVNKMRKLWDNNVATAEIARRLNVQKSSIERKTKEWKRPISYYKTARLRRKFDYHVMYCLLEEHGLTFKEAAFALDAHVNTVRRIMREYRTEIEATYDQWKQEYTKGK